MSVYQLNIRFQALLRPFVSRLAEKGTTANEVTLMALTGSLVIGSYLLAGADRRWFLILPLWFVVRMAMCAVAGMLTSAHGRKSLLGTYLDEFGDILSNAVLLIPFALIAPFSLGWLAAIIALFTLSEFAGILGPSVGASRRRDGPFGNVEAAVVFGFLGAWVGIAGDLPPWLHLLQPAICLALVLTIINRIRAGIREAEAAAFGPEVPKDSIDT